MTKRSLRVWMLAGLCAAALAQPARAQRIDSPFRFLDHNMYTGPFAGYAWLSEGRVGLGPEPAPIFGASWALRVSGPFALAVDLGYLSTTRTVRDTVFIAADDEYEPTGEADVSLAIALASLRFNLTGARTWHRLQPYVLLGVGAAADLAGSTAADLDLVPEARFDMGTSFAGQVGAGIDVFPSSRVSIRLDARNMLWKLDIPDAFRLTENGADFGSSEWEQNFVLAAGLSIHF